MTNGGGGGGGGGGEAAYLIHCPFQYLVFIEKCYKKWRFRNLYPLFTCRLYVPFLNKTVIRISPPFRVYFSLVPGYFSDTRFNHCLPVYPPSLHCTPLLLKVSYVVMFEVFKKRCLASRQGVYCPSDINGCYNNPKEDGFFDGTLIEDSKKSTTHS